MRSLRSAGLVLALVVLGACEKGGTFMEPPLREIVSINVGQPASDIVVGGQTFVSITTTIVGREVAAFSDTSVVKLDSKIATAKRVVWIQNFGFDERAQRPYVDVTETYLVTGVSVGNTQFTASSINDRAATGTSLIRVFTPGKG